MMHLETDSSARKIIALFGHWPEHVGVAQALPHFMLPALHVKPHMPPEHVAIELLGVGQRLLQLPQWLVSLDRLTQLFPH